MSSTKGNWVVEPVMGLGDQPAFYEVRLEGDRNRGPVATCYPYDGDNVINHDEAKANAHRIAAVNDLEKALVDLAAAVIMEGMDGCFVTQIAQADKALAKAKGE